MPWMPPENIDDYLLPIGPARASYSFNEEFTSDELRTALQMYRQQIVPREDEKMYKALKSLDQSFRHILLEVCNAVR